MVTEMVLGKSMEGSLTDIEAGCGRRPRGIPETIMRCSNLAPQSHPAGDGGLEVAAGGRRCDALVGGKETMEEIAVW
jgi:hypothetical protein